ncbi:GntR family transcriptional regulator [Shewanella schlegeliana]|uniref:GntR family transcriptional regulator n=1 Tax=Shewanella schlegeliana TaxID=190308 RepID=A0ABS1T132_9GAMM|nr:GntR family transcriptional regulator [Shewanella schlegeliana]MBL4914483.1 GntR family transcriptional regulator [Shewanella schlegeliana]MCL1109701.1 GntR family transcriptional regulator [Shewanella schlegeliana]GIU33358.1 GntR family transcriptional regulator [Shewanella schlegeliana]
MKITKESLESQAVRYLRTHILEGHIKLGDKLVESALAKQLELSRSTVRMALNSLVNEGLVIQKPYSGWQVVEINQQDLWELYHLRVALESEAAAMAAKWASADDKAGLADFFQEYQLLCLQHGDDTRRISEMDWQLHLMIIKICGSERMLNQYKQILYPLQAYIALTHQDYDLSDSASSHQALVQAICAGDAETAAQQARANITPMLRGADVV